MSVDFNPIMVFSSTTFSMKMWVENESWYLAIASINMYQRFNGCLILSSPLWFSHFAILSLKHLMFSPRLLGVATDSTRALSLGLQPTATMHEALASGKHPMALAHFGILPTFFGRLSPPQTNKNCPDDPVLTGHETIRASDGQVMIHPTKRSLHPCKTRAPSLGQKNCAKKMC